jgi:hypothetical protein
MIAGQLALLIAGIFTGAALYINFAEQPARLALDDSALLIEWKLAYRRGFLLQAPLAVLGCLLGIWAWHSTGRMAFLVGALLMIANWPWTLFVIARINARLMAIAPRDANGESRALMVRWNRVHAVRTILGCLAALAFLFGLMVSRGLV